MLLLTLPLSCLATRPAGYCWPDVPVIVQVLDDSVQPLSSTLAIVFAAAADADERVRATAKDVQPMDSF